jgi:hypothetical protein
MNDADDCFGEDRLGESSRSMPPAVGRAARAHPARDRRVCRRRAAARRHDDDPAADRRRGRRLASSAPSGGDGASVSDFVTIFSTRSDVEADVVRGLLEANGVMPIVSSAHSRIVFPVTVSELARFASRSHRRKPTSAGGSSRGTAPNCRRAVVACATSSRACSARSSYRSAIAAARARDDALPRGQTRT